MPNQVDLEFGGLILVGLAAAWLVAVVLSLIWVGFRKLFRR